MLIRKQPLGWFFVRHISDGTAAGNLFTPPFTHIKPSTDQDAISHMTAVKEAPPTASAVRLTGSRWHLRPTLQGATGRVLQP